MISAWVWQYDGLPNKRIKRYSCSPHRGVAEIDPRQIKWLTTWHRLHTIVKHRREIRNLGFLKNRLATKLGHHNFIPSVQV